MAKKPISKVDESANPTDAEIIKALHRVKCQLQLGMIVTALDMKSAVSNVDIEKIYES